LGHAGGTEMGGRARHRKDCQKRALLLRRSPAVARRRQPRTAETRHFRSTLTLLTHFSLLRDNTLHRPAPGALPCLFKGKGSPASSGSTASRLTLGLAALQHGRQPSSGVASRAPGRAELGQRRGRRDQYRRHAEPVTASGLSHHVSKCFSAEPSRA